MPEEIMNDDATFRQPCVDSHTVLVDVGRLMNVSLVCCPQHHRSIQWTPCLRESGCPLLWTWRGNTTLQVRIKNTPSDQAELREAVRTLCWGSFRRHAAYAYANRVSSTVRLLLCGPPSPEPRWCLQRYFMLSLRCSHVRSEQALDMVAAAVEKVVRAHALPELKRIVLFHSMRGEILSKERAPSTLEWLQMVWHIIGFKLRPWVVQ